MNADKLVIGLTGMPGSGKSLVVKAAQELGYDVVTMGDVIREETAKKGLELNPANVGKVMLELRAANGHNVIAEKCVPKIEHEQNPKVIVDGIRSLVEANTFKSHFSKFVLIAVHAPPTLRFTRLSNRGRSDDPKTFDVFHERDMRELGVGLGNAIALAEFLIINDNNIDTLKSRVKETLQKAEQKWTK
jgi:dephospho-CoA kinase